MLKDKPNNFYFHQGVQVTVLSFIINIGLAGGKMILGLLTHSQALFADGLHSLVDLSTDIAALFGLKMVVIPEDENHPYGHHKFASLSNFFIGLVVLVFCGLLIYSSFKGLMESRVANPTWLALSTALISTLLKEFLYWRTRIVAKKHKSRLLMANAWHHRLDAFTSLVTLIALSMIFFGGPQWAFVDKVVGFGVGIYIAYEGIKIFHNACKDLLDAAPENTVIDDIREHTLSVDGAIAYHNLRARRIGDMIEVDLHLQVNPNITVDAGHHIASLVKQNILKHHKEVYNVLVHVEPATERHIKEEGVSDAQSDLI